jgi:3-phenylpropionate/trans-cinnamate dioxygenase ferredoxin component
MMAESDTARVRVGAYDELESGTPSRVDLAGTKVAVVRAGDDLYAVADRCSHANYSLSEGEVDTDELTIECWKHGALFSLCTGEALTLPAIAPVATYRVEVVDGEVYVSESPEESPS